MLSASSSSSLFSLLGMVSPLMVRHGFGEEHDTGGGDSGGGGSGGAGGGDAGSGAEGGDGGSAGGYGGATDSQAASKRTDTNLWCHCGSRSRWRVLQVHLFDPVHVPQPNSQTFCTVKVRSLNAFAPMASDAPSYSIFSVARFDCAKPCCPTEVQPAVIVAQPPGMVVFLLYPF